MPEEKGQEKSQENTIPLKVLRSSLPLTQRELASLASLNERTITALERGIRPVRLTTAFSIVNAINNILEEKGRPKVTIFDIAWRLEETPDLEALRRIG
jgi:DNA-binding XRE family transcriptional regulator